MVSHAAVPRTSHACSMSRYGLLLQERLELGTREDGLGLLERLDLLVAGGLTDVEVRLHEVTALVELRFVVRELLELEHRRLLVLLGLDQVALSLGLGLGFVYDVGALRLDGRVRLLDEILVRLL